MTVRSFEPLAIGTARYILAGLFLLSPAGASYASPAPKPNLEAAQEAWRTAIAQAVQHEAGCFQAKYPDKNWRPIPCGTEEPEPNVQHGRVFRPLDETSSGNHTALSSGSITSATGFFPAIANVTQAAGFGFQNNFTIQMNTNGFASPFCKASHNSSACVGWEQFVVDSGGSINIQVWLFSYLDTVTVNCPDSSWNQYGTGCWKKAVETGKNTDLPVHTFNTLQGIFLKANAAIDGKDSFTMILGGIGTAIVLPAGLSSGLANNWKVVDFNVYGESNNEVIFNPGAVMSVVVQVTDGSPKPPTCSTPPGAHTLETSNLTLGPCVSVPAFLGAAHGITFTEGVPATVTGIDPASGPKAGGTIVTINGTGMSNNIAVKFGETYARSVHCTGPSTCQAVSPPGSGPVDITVVNLTSSGLEGILSAPFGKFNYYAPLACKFSEFDCPQGGGTQTYSVSCPTPVNFSLNGQYQKTATLFSGQELGARQPSYVTACETGTTNCQGFTTTSTATCPVGPINSPPSPVQNCRSCLETGRQCIAVPGGHQCKGTVQ